MKIIAGKFKGKNLDYRHRRGLRVTSQKVKEAMFGIIGDRVEDAAVLDIYCGYGSLGIEAISRGAKEVIFVDVDGGSLKQLKYFLDKLNVLDQTTLIKRDAIKALKHQDPNAFDLILMDPPYHIKVEEKTLESILKYEILKKGGMCVVEHYFENVLADRIGTLVKKKVKKYGDTCLSIFVNEDEKTDAAQNEAENPVEVEEENPD